MNGHLPIMPPESYRSIELKVVPLLLKYQPNALAGKEPVDVESLFEFVLPKIIPGLKTGYVGLGPGVEGVTSAEDMTCYVAKSLSDSEDSVMLRRLRATIAHEMGHAILHLKSLHFISQKSRGDRLHRVVEASKIETCRNPEWQAWAFGGSLLMPRGAVTRLMSAGYGQSEMIELFDVNPSFFETRMRALRK